MALPRGMNVHQLFERQAERTPDAVALDGAEGKVTYRELHDRSRRIASGLRARGVGRSPGEIVATCLTPSTDTVASFLAIMSLGASYCPLDPSFPAARLEFIVSDARPTAIIADEALTSSVPPTDVPILLFPELAAHGGDGSNEASPPASADAAACVLYTSGSTGKPKGALVPHRGIVRLVFGMRDVEFGPELRVLVHSPLGFDASTFEIFGPLLHGGTAVIFEGGGVPSLRELRDAIERHEVNCLLFGPAPTNIIIDEQPEVLARLKVMVVGGEAMSAKHARKCGEIHPHLRLINAYGPTEATTISSTYAVPADLPEEAATVPIGRPLEATTYYLADEEGREIAGEGTGELLIGGDGVALGYLNRPELTAEKFIANPFRAGSGEDPVLYRTGDLCRRLADGNYDYVGRMDTLVKISGMRIELGEIEAAIAAHPGVSQAVAVVREERGGPRIAAYYTGVPGTGGAAPEDLRSALAGQVPHFMVPTWLVPLAAMPVTRSGKVDRGALPSPHGRAPAARAAAEPTEALTRELLEMWRQVLGAGGAGAEDSFFEAGGTSLGAMRLCAMIERKTGVFVPVSSLFAAPSAEKMAGVIRARRSGETERAGLAIKLREGEGAPLFCVPGQGGSALGFAELAKHLPEGLPAHGLNFPGVDGLEVPSEDIGVTASRLVDEIRRVQPAGPRRLVGYSLGGVVAYEAARQLRARGETMDLLVLLDAFTPGSFRVRNRAGKLLVHARRAARRAFRRGPAGPEQLSASPDIDGDEEGPLHDAIRRVRRANTAALEAYRPGRYDGETRVVMAEECPGWYDFYVVDPSGGWQEHVPPGQLRRHTTPGSHISMLHQPNVASLAEKIAGWLGAAEARR